MTTERLTDQEWRPNLFIPGFAKCRTTEFCDYLSQHPDIFLSSFAKEPNTFYDLAKYPPYITGDLTGKTRRVYMSLTDYYNLFSKRTKYRYRVDGTVTYTYDSKFSRILKSFSENAKVILLIRDQKRRLASMYFYSFVHHKENDFTKWLPDYFIPYMKTYLYFDKIVAYHHEFGDNLSIIESSSMSSEDVHKQLFEFLEVKPIKISIRHENANMLGPADSKAYRRLILGLTSIRLATLRCTKYIGLEKQGARASFAMAYLARKSIKKRQNIKKDNNYSDMIKLIPHAISSILDEDYKKSLDFAIQKKILICTAC